MMTMEAARDLIGKSEIGILGTNGANGYPYLTPLNFVFKDDKIYFHSALEGGKLDNIEADSRVSFCVTGDVELLREQFDSDYKSVIVFGEAHEVFREEKLDALKAIIAKYSPGFEKKGDDYIIKSEGATRVFGIEIEHMTGKFQSSR